MTELLEEFVVDSVPEDDRSFEPIPAGEYQMQVIDSAIQPTKNGTGEILILTLEVVDGQHVRRRVWDRLNIRNQNPQAQSIAQRSLADLCLAIGVNSLRNTEELHFKPFRARLTIREDKTGQYGPQNSVRYKVGGGQPPQAIKAPVQSKSAPPSPAPKASGARPWSIK